MTSRRDPRSWRSATQLVRGGTKRSDNCETAEAIYMTSGYVYESPEEAESAFNGNKQRFVYSRFANPTNAMFEERMALLEGVQFARGTASGMAAVFASLMASVRAGDRVVASRALFGSCHYIVSQLLPTYGVETELVDGTDPAAWERALSKPAAAVLVETPSNPTLEIIDLEMVAVLCKKAGARLVVDNVFATPVLQKPMRLGADVVVYSATKHIDGQGRCMGGVILTDDGQWVEDRLNPFLRNTGPSMSPFNAWVLLKGLETLDLRVRRQSENAATVATFLEGRAGISRVLYPSLPSHPQHNLAMRQMDGGGSMLCIELAGGKAAAYRFLNGLSLIDISNNLGDAKTLATHPPTTTHQRLTEDERLGLGITQGMVRISVGLEDAADLCEDLEEALSA